MDKRFYVTTPIYYVNAEPHIGHAYTTILADFLKRFHTMLGYDSFFLTGTDEHGDKIVKAAQANGTSPAEYTDRISSLFKRTWEETGLDFDDFIRTTEDRHKNAVKYILQKVYESGDIYFGSYGGYYCFGCERYFTEKEMIDGKCPDHDKTLEYIEESNYFFKMSKYQGWLIDHIKKNPDFIRPERYKNEVLSMLEGESLEDLCISRPKSRLQWGIPLPFDENYVTYVWFDALINYVSALGYPDGEKFKKYWPSTQHIIAKDIVKPHGIFWPTMLKSAGIEPYQHLNVHGYWNWEDAKMSKSLGNVVRPKELIEKYGDDQIRYFLLREMTFGLDAKFSEEAIINRVNYDLANDLGNLVKRCFNMTEKFFQGKIPPRAVSEKAGIEQMQEKLAASLDDYITNITVFKFNTGLEHLWEFVRSLNRYIDDWKPWVLDREGNREVLASVIRNLLEACYSLAFVLSPVLRNASGKIIGALNAGSKKYNRDGIISLDNLRDGDEIKDIGILFPRLEKEGANDEAKDIKDKKGKKMNENDGLIDIQEFTKVDIRVAQVIEASRVEGSEKLLELKIDSGLDIRTIVAGIAKNYEPESITGKKILLVANLKPATIFKKTSQGMLLAAKKEKNDAPVLIIVDPTIPNGSRLG